MRLTGRACHARTAVTGIAGGVACALALAVCAGATAQASSASAATRTAGGSPASSSTRLANTAHLDSLLASVTPPAQPGHSTYGGAARPSIGVLWVYANRQADGSYRNTGGGSYDAASNTYGQGAFDADDIARASVVYLRQWRDEHDPTALGKAEGLLRGLTYLQTDSGPNAGNVVLWMQPDGTLNPTPTPPDSPNPSDTGVSFWLARTLWALGEGYQDLKGVDPSFAGFLAGRLQLAVDALNREVLNRYGSFQTVHGTSQPSWLIGDGADASSEAVLGLSAAVRAGIGGAPRRALAELAAGIADLGHAPAGNWPYGAILPSATMLGNWHAWASQMPEALVLASSALGSPGLLRPAVSDASSFTPYLLATTGASNGWLPSPSDNNQIAYGVDSRVQSLAAVAAARHSTALAQLAGVSAGWFFGANNAGVPIYDPGTGVGFDGVGPDGSVNRNSGAESTIHALLTMQLLDRQPAMRRWALAGWSRPRRDAQVVLEAESASLGGDAQVVRPASAWNGEALYSGGGYVASAASGSITWNLGTDGLGSGRPLLARVVVDRMTQGGTAVVTAAGRTLGRVALGGAGAQGNAPAPDELIPVTLTVAIPAGATQVTAQLTGGGRVDALQVEPLVSSVVFGGSSPAVELLSNQSGSSHRATLAVPARSVLVVGPDGRQTSYPARGATSVAIPSGGWALTTP